ncbi:hypothetical protein [Pedococcus dokdonensis]|nr:hypothetical protein [Pedococcus dokdonensis]
MIPVLVIAAFGVDFGNAYTQGQAFAAGADSGALAITQRAQSMMTQSPSTYPNCAAVVNADPGFTNAKALALSAVNANAPFSRQLPASAVNATMTCQGASLVADVTVQANVGTSIGGMVGVSSIAANRAAQAVIDLGGRSKCGLCIIGPGSHDLQNGSVTVNQAGVSVNGTVVANPQGEITIVTTGTDVISFQGSTPNKGTYVPTPLENQPPIADPLAGLLLPPASVSTLAVKTNPCTDGPGIYLNSIDASDPCIMSTGLYVFAGQFDLKNRTVRANGVTMYFTCKTTTSPITIRPCSSGGEDGGNMQQAGNGDFIFSAPTTGDTAGLALVADRNNTATSSYRGSATGQSTGTIYLKSGTLDFRGTAGTTSLDSLVITGNMTFSGQAPVIITYTESKNVPIPATNNRLTR